MAARKTAVQFVDERSTWRGDRVRRYTSCVAGTWRITEVRIRTGRRGRDGNGGRDLANTQAKQVATWRLTARPGSVRFIGRRTNDFNGLTFDDYENTGGHQVTITVNPGAFLSRKQPLTRAQTRAAAIRQLGGRR